MPSERSSPSGGWREVCREMGAGTAAEEPQPCRVCDRPSSASVEGPYCRRHRSERADKPSDTGSGPTPRDDGAGRGAADGDGAGDRASDGAAGDDGVGEAADDRESCGRRSELGRFAD